MSQITHCPGRIDHGYSIAAECRDCLRREPPLRPGPVSWIAPQQAELPMPERETEDLWSRPSRPSLDAASAYSSMLLSMLVRTNKR